MNASSAPVEWVGRVIDGRFPLLQLLGSTLRSSVFLTEVGEIAQRATIKLVPARAACAEIQLAAWHAVQELSHSHLMQVFASGRCELDSEPYLFFVSEFADEVLADLLPNRALNPQEAREMLAPTLSALAYLQENGLVHHSLKPSNIMAIGENLKLTVDGLLPEGSTLEGAAEQTVYDAPEIACNPLTAASEVWSLGILLVEILTQRTPTWDDSSLHEPVVPLSIPQPFNAVARRCLRTDPARRSTIAQIRSRLFPESDPAATPERHNDHRRSVTKLRLGVTIVGCAIVLATGAIWGAFEFHHERSSPAAYKPAPPSTSTDQPSPPSPLVQPVASTVALPGPSVPRETPSSHQAAAQPATRPIETAPPQAIQPADTPPRSAPVAPPSGGAGAEGAVSEQVKPDVLAAAMRTISGSVKVAVRVSVDPTGDVTAAEFDSPGPSKYFAAKSLEAARHFVFQPAQAQGRPVASTWIIKFEFRRAGITITQSETAP